MEDKISINKVFALYLSVESHYRSYQAAKYTLDKILKYEPKSHTVFMDAYDVCNLIYPKSIMIGDNHYDIVKQLWLEFFALCNMEEIPFKIQTVIPPAATYEILEFAYERIVPIQEGFVLKKKTIELKKWLEAINKNWREYTQIEPFLHGNKVDDYVRKLKNLYSNSKMVEFSELIKRKDVFRKAKTMNDLQVQVSEEIDFSKGINSFGERRPYKPLSNEIDMRNLVTCVAYKKSVPKKNKHSELITSHSGHTLGGWSDSWTANISDSPIRASLSENIVVTSIIRKKGDIEEARDFTVEGAILCRNIMRDLQTIPEIENYVKEKSRNKRNKMRNKFRRDNIHVGILPRCCVNIEEWQHEFVRTKISEEQHSVQKKLDYNIAEQLLRDETYRRKLANQASYNVKKMFSELDRQQILSFDMLFIPEDQKCLEVLNWLEEAK